MRVEIRPSRLAGVTVAPPSKSMGHRLLLAAGLAKGESRVCGISDSEDMKATLDVLSALGVRWQREGDTVTLWGCDPAAATAATLPCRESGSTLRFALPLCLLCGEEMTLTGSGRLLERPLSVYEELCREEGLLFRKTENAVTVRGPLRAGELSVRGDISSQFITGLLYALPLCEGDSVIRLIPPVESRSYLDLTVAALAEFGITVVWEDALTLRVKGGQTYRPTCAVVEGDYSNAAFFEALCTLGHEVSVSGLSEASRQGDRVYRTVLPQLAAGTPTVSLGDCPDLGPVLMAIAAALHGARFTDTARLRIKESDRGAAMAAELAKFGVDVTVRENDIVVAGGGLTPPREALDGHNDHRIVMSLATLLTVTGGVIDGAEAVRKSLPDYFERLRALGAEVEYKNA